MPETRGPDFQGLADAFRPIAAELSKIGRSFSEAMTRFWDSPDGRYLKAVVDYYERHPEQLDAMIAAREVEAQADTCHCLCQRWDHLGACTGRAATERTFAQSGLGAIAVPMCSACAASVDQQLAAAQR